MGVPEQAEAEHRTKLLNERDALMRLTIRLIAMDMDGTLLDPEQRLSEPNRLALLEAQRAGIRLAICSGRMPGDSALFAIENGLEEIAVLGLNGGCCQKSPKAEPYVNHVLPAAAAQGLCARFAEAGITFGLFLQNTVVVFQGRKQLEKKDWGSHWDAPGAPEMLYGGDISLLAARGVNKIVCVDDDAALLHSYRTALEKDPALLVSSSWENNIELMPAGIDKGLALRELCRELGIPLRAVMALGDYDNDLSMFACAGLAVAMGNAPEYVKAAAHAVTLTNGEDGVAHAIRAWALSGKER